jgi:16S rRNA processing protein RimM
MENTTEWATIGKIVAPFGIRGELKVFSLSDVPDRFATLKVVYVGLEHAVYKMKSVRPYKGDMLVLKLESVNDANMAEILRNQDICIPISELATLPPDFYYQHDILGLQVYLLTNQELGVITDIWSTGGSDIYVIKGQDGQEILIPAIKEVIKQIDLIRHVMYIDPMKGLLDDEAIIVDPNDEEVE